MVDLSVYHNGSTTLPLERADNGIVVPSGTLADRQDDVRQIIQDQIRHGELADAAGFDRFFLTEHHFEMAGLEFNANPMFVQMAIASRTEDIRLGQLANIITWRDPVRMAEQTATLDVVSDGRVDVGIGRGYAPRENEILGQYWGGGIQNDEQNRVSFEEKVDILRRAWTDSLLSYHGEYHDIPPSHTKWHNELDRTYLEALDDTDVRDVIDWGSADRSHTVYSGDSTLSSIAVYPQPVQKPHPQLWQPVTSDRSMQWAARNGVNAVIALRPHSQVQSMVDTYYETAEEAGWPDRRPEYDGEPFRYGWDESRDRGVGLYKPVFNTAIATEDELERWIRGMEHIWYWFREFLPGGLEMVLDLSEEETRDLRERQNLDEDDPLVLDRQILEKKQLAIIGDADEICDQIASIKETYDYEDFCFMALFESSSMTGEEADRQLEAFAEDVMPYLRETYPSPT